MCEIIDLHATAFKGMSSFLDLGCAPGGFAARLLEADESVTGFGVSIPSEQGGFPVLLRHERFKVQMSDLMDLHSISDLECSVDVDLCLGDAQDLGRRVRPEGARKGGKKGQPQASGGNSVGVQAASSVLGIWALTFQELMLGFGRLRAGGSLVFRFGWRGRGSNEEQWYRDATRRLFALIHVHFEEVWPFKSEFSHQADPCFYVVARGFKRDAYVAAQLHDRICEAIAAMITCSKYQDLPGLLWFLRDFVTDEVCERIDSQLDAVGKLRQIGISTRRRVQDQGKGTGEAGLYISPVPFNLTLQRIRERLEKYGKISYVKRRAHPIGVGADAVVQFAQPAHAAAALKAIVETRVLGDNIAVTRLSDMRNPAA